MGWKGLIKQEDDGCICHKDWLDAKDCQQDKEHSSLDFDNQDNDLDIARPSWLSQDHLDPMPR